LFALGHREAVMSCGAKVGGSPAARERGACRKKNLSQPWFKTAKKGTQFVAAADSGTSQ